MCDRSTRLRKAILGLTVMEKIAPDVTPKDIQSKWSFLNKSGATPYDLAKEANSKDIKEDRFKYLMSLLNSYL